ncbi:unnamed protein product (macronuclear) [Paramecium tetraurelia]|uniref:Uncharacterized protein n=1 Tax=Paramecium tetraurelia TaxID=5888 RepID=A0D2W1_PARTE|nr:uncharacterized protein GSPATT00039205001 [Paramecium tetraurelia]CAK77378.1 unnamed protein product [Paramecium tetraurelia]|eukprot:XP_001444775.1 hypothetical protein (macronuclear) [Paramecium tetraurelia strain d4-2]
MNLLRFEEANQTYDLAIQNNPEDSDLLNDKANVLVRFGKYDEALKFLDYAISNNPNNALYFFNKGNKIQRIMKEMYQKIWEDLMKRYNTMTMQFSKSLMIQLFIVLKVEVIIFVSKYFNQAEQIQGSIINLQLCDLDKS